MDNRLQNVHTLATTKLAPGQLQITYFNITIQIFNRCYASLTFIIQHILWHTSLTNCSLAQFAGLSTYNSVQTFLFYIVFYKNQLNKKFIKILITCTTICLIHVHVHCTYFFNWRWNGNVVFRVFAISCRHINWSLTDIIFQKMVFSIGIRIHGRR